MEGFLKQSTAVNVTVTMIDSADHVSGKTGLTLTMYATKAAGTPAAITPTVTELDSTHCPGLYELAYTTAHTNTLGELQLHITGTGADPADLKWQVSTYLPGEAATLQADQAVNTTKIGGTSQTARDIGASVLLSTGTGTGQLDFTSGVVKANLAQILGTALTETAGLLAGGFKKFFNIATPASTMDALTLVTTATNLTNAPTSGDLTSTMKTSIGTAVAASAVASVAGNVGGNVAGSVGSVASGGIAAASFAANAITATAIAANAITAAKVATDAIGAAQLAADAVTEIQSGLSTLDAAGIRTAMGLASANLDTQLAALPTAAENADAVWDEAIADHVDDGSTGDALNDAGAAGNPWDSVLEGSLTAGDMQRINTGVLAGKTSRVGAVATFRDASDASDIVVAHMTDSERTSVTLSP